MIDIESRIICRRDSRLVCGWTPTSQIFRGTIRCRGTEVSRLCVVECGPSIHTIRVVEPRLFNYEIKWEKRNYVLAFPYLQFFVLRQAEENPAEIPYVTWSSKPLEDFTQKVQPVLLPNVYSSGRMCPGRAWDYYVPHTPEAIIPIFWNACFTPEEFNWPYKRLLKDTPLRDFAHWADLTERHGGPDFMIDLIERVAPEWQRKTIPYLVSCNE
jgi:hypothetical protein